MRTVLAEDDGSEWSIEILDGNHVNSHTAKPVKQTPPTSASRELHPFFLSDCSTIATAPQVVAKCMLDARRTPLCIHPRELAEGGRQTTVASHGRMVRPNLKPTSHAHDSPNMSLPNNHHHEYIPSQEIRQFARSHPPVQLTRDASSSSSQNSLGSSGGESSLPIYSFMEYKDAPAVVYTKSENEANSLVQTLKGPLGFDLEWRVMWHPGAQERRTALVQLCDHDRILLIQVSSMQRFPRKVLEVIESADIVKTGANILNDGEKLFRDFGIRAKGLVELGAFASKADDTFSSLYNREIVSLAKMVATYLGRTLLKGKVRTSNWEANLSDEMIEYAANDCHCALMVYDRLEEIAFQAGKTLDRSMYSGQVDPRMLNLKLDNALRKAQQRDAPAKPALPDYCIPEPPRPQQLRAYKLWHLDKMPLERMCLTLRTGGRVEPLKESTVISYVVGALQADPRLPFNMTDLKSLVLMEASSWQRHRQWIASRE